MTNTARFLMCPPEFFGVEYVINPWMQGKQGTVGVMEAHQQWAALHRLLTQELGAKVELVPPQPGLPDIVFTANAGLVRGGVCVPARFRYAERQGEEPHYRAWFEANGFALRDLPPGIAFEGAGDALFHEDGRDGRPLLWAAHGFRSDAAAHPHLAEVFGAEVVSLALVDPRYYHLDTCLCPLPGGFLLWYPQAFDAESRTKVESVVPEEMRLAVSDADAAAFACNAVAVGRSHVVSNTVGEEIGCWLQLRGFTLHQTPLGEFLKAGGSAKCLTLRLDH
mgnify:CR=1 FL=1|jgi:N-Dimethylarginine dimethylaminohydrolase